MTSLAVLAIALAASAAASPSNAQDKPQSDPPPAQPAPEPSAPTKPATTVEGVTVTADPNGFHSAIDRKSYDLTKDLQAQAGAPIGDALRNLPGVNVDVQGDISIRGDSNVVILVDGKPSSLFSGPGRAQVLQSLPADQYERAEVLTNPSAQYSPDGSAGIINLITRKSHKPTSSGSVRVMEGTSDHWRVGASGTYVAGPLSINGNAGVANNLVRGGKVTTREGFDGAGAPTFSSFENDTLINTQVFKFATGGVDYDVDDKDRLSARLNYFNGVEGGSGAAPLREFDGSGAPLLVEDRIEHLSFPLSDLTGELSYRRTFDGDQHDLTLSASSERFDLSAPDRNTVTNILPAAPQSFQALFFRDVNVTDIVKADYEQPMPRGGQWKLGYEFDDERDRFSNSGFQDAPTPQGPLDSAQTNLFGFNRTIQALYTTYQQPFGKLTVLAGLRYEATNLGLDQETQKVTIARHDGRLYPSLHFSYQIDDAQQLTASYSQRIERPQPQQYNPFRTILGPLNLQEGNPLLESQQTQDFELGYEYKRGSTYYLATLYYKDNREGVTPVEQDLGGGVILTTQQNLASSRNSGLELAASGKLFKAITYNLSTDGAWIQVDATPLGFQTRQSAYSLSARGTIAWQTTVNDMLQANGFVGGKRLTAQGYEQMPSMLFLGYRHKFNPHLSLFITALDVLNSARYLTELNTALLREDTRFQFRQRAVLVGLTYSFGGATKRAPEFDFGGGSGPH